MTARMDAASAIRPSPGYLFTLAIGCVGLPFIGIGLGGALIGRAGGDPIRAMDVDGMVMFILAFAVGFAMRLIFWPPAPPSLRQIVRLLISVVLAAEIPLALLGLALAWQLPPGTRHAVLPLYFSVLAVLCQPVAALWLARYRREGL